MTLVLRRSAAPLADIRRLNQWVDDAFAGWPFAPDAATRSGGAWAPAVDIIETKEEIRIVAELPGLTPGDVKLSLENRTLTIRGEKQPSIVEEKEATVHRAERSYGVFERTFTLPDTVDSERVQAGFEHGVLTISLPKAERAKPRSIEVKVK